mgnify:CR=1 FL=1
MPTLSLDKEAIKSIKSSIDFKKNILLLNRKIYLSRLKEFEKKYGMTTARFLKKFNSGEIEDESDWFDWQFLHQALTRIDNEITILRNTGI